MKAGGGDAVAAADGATNVRVSEGGDVQAGEARAGLPRQRLSGEHLAGDGAIALPVAGTSPLAEAGEALASATLDRGSRLAAAVSAARGAWLRRYGLIVEFALAMIAGLAVIAVIGDQPAALAAVLAIWAVATFHPGQAVTSPLVRPFRRAATNLAPALAVAGLAVGFFSIDTDLVRQALPVVVTATLVSTGCRLVRWRLQSPVRVIAVGDRVGVLETINVFARKGHWQVVAAVVTEKDLTPADLDHQSFGVPVGLGLPAATGLAEQWNADLVVVSPGPGMSSGDLRRLNRSLEPSAASLGLLGLLDQVAPHRITPGWMAGATILDIRSPRPSVWVHAMKTLFDRAVAAVGLVLTAPLLLTLMAAVRLDSRGPAIFRQTRVGRDGKHFEVLKLRTMVDGADELKSTLSSNVVDETVLFKMRRDPRITRVGGFLRRSSLDELPQLINVLKGDMSLVGPRPFLPHETGQMDAEARRRLAVRPGITGLWQVSGRSDLSWEESVRLDTFYADNWSLGGDLRILAKTVPAVFRGRGAY